MFGSKKKTVQEAPAKEPVKFDFPEGSKAKIVVVLEKESLWSKAGGKGGTFNLLMSDKINVQIDDGAVMKLARKKPDTPFEFEVDPGEHVIIFTDPSAKAKNRFTVGSIMGLAAGLAGGSITDAIYGYSLGMRTKVDDGVVSVVLLPDDVLTISAKCTSKGKVKLNIVE